MWRSTILEPSIPLRYTLTQLHTHSYTTHMHPQMHTLVHMYSHTPHTHTHTHVHIKNLYTKVEELEHLNTSLQERLSLSLPTSPTLQSGDLNTSLPCQSILPSLSVCSLHPHLDDEFGSQLSLWSEGGGSFQQQFDQMEFEREEMKAKYEEIKVGGWKLGTKYHMIVCGTT